MSLKSRMNDMLELRNMTKKELVLKTGIHRSQLAQYRTGKRNRLHISVLRKIANALGCTVGWLVQDTDKGDD